MVDAQDKQVEQAWDLEQQSTGSLAERLSQSSHEHDESGIKAPLTAANLNSDPRGINAPDSKKPATRVTLDDDGMVSCDVAGASMGDIEIPKRQKGKCEKSCTSCCVNCMMRCRPILTEFNPLPESPSLGQRIKYGCRCPPHGILGKWWTQALVMVFLWAVAWSVTGEQALPGGNIFALIVLFILCNIGGDLVAKLKLPALLGMLIVGCLLRNVPRVNVGKDLDPLWSGAIRNIALVVILIRAGLGLDPKALRKLSFGVIRLAFLPCLTETVACAVSSHLLLGFPWVWGFMLGFVLAAVSPAVVVPSMLSLGEKGYGVDKGIPTLVIAAASVDDVLAISGFGVVLGIAFSKGELALTIVKGPLEAVAGVLFGLIFGIISWYIPHVKDRYCTLYRFMLLFCGGLLATFGSRALHIAGAGALGCLTMAFVVGLRWRSETKPGQEMPMTQIFGVLWIIFQPLLFGLIGAEVNLSEIQLTTIGLGIAVLCIGLVLRCVVSFLAVLGLGLTLKEKIFIPFAWLPKATVQAAIGSIALDTARQANAGNDEIELGKQVLTIAVLVILITAPIGAIAIALVAPRTLNKTPKPIYEIELETQHNGRQSRTSLEGHAEERASLREA